MNLKNKFIIFLIFFLNCQKIFIDIYPEINLHNKIDKSSLEKVCYNIDSVHNVDIDTNKFVRAYSISRLFYSYVENQSGTLKEILMNGIEKRFYYDPIDLRRELQPQSCLAYIFITIENYDFSWYPPQEFIQHPDPIRKGSFKGQLEARYILKFNKEIEKQFSHNIIQNILPKKEFISIQNTIEQLLRDFIDEVHREFWLGQ